jgi:hypothetical protein
VIYHAVGLVYQSIYTRTSCGKYKKKGKILFPNLKKEKKRIGWEGEEREKPRQTPLPISPFVVPINI